MHSQATGAVQLRSCTAGLPELLFAVVLLAAQPPSGCFSSHHQRRRTRGDSRSHLFIFVFGRCPRAPLGCCACQRNSSNQQPWEPNVAASFAAAPLPKLGHAWHVYFAGSLGRQMSSVRYQSINQSISRPGPQTRNVTRSPHLCQIDNSMPRPHRAAHSWARTSRANLPSAQARKCASAHSLPNILVPRENERDGCAGPSSSCERTDRRARTERRA